jgi:predicted 2-oxoglutarate/Fe(II)-dependent dioxygenase YbiX
MLDQLTMFERLGLFVIRDFLDRSLCQQILAESQQATEFQPAQIHKGQGQFAVDETIRKVQETQLSRSTIQAVSQQLQVVKPKLEVRFQVKLVDCQGPSFLFYRAGGFYRPHKDRDFSKNHSHINQRRRVSTVIFINGETHRTKPDPSEINTYGGGLNFLWFMQK